MNYKFSKKSWKQLEEIEIMLAAVMVVALRESPYDFGIIEGKRTAARQLELFERGRVTTGKIVTTKDGVVLRSKHQDGKAVDICIYENGEYVWNHSGNAELAEHILKIASEMGVPLTWGGLWGKLRDEPHYELK